jgi:ParB family chromosome partitioning protein
MQTLTKADLGNQQTVRENSTRAEEVVKIPITKIVMRDGFNVRQSYGDTDSLAYSILENGQVQPGRVDVLADGSFVLVDGHRRFIALQQLAKLGYDEPFFKAIVNTKSTTEEQRILQMFTTQDNKQLEPCEVAELIKRLVNIGYNASEIAKKIGKSHTYVGNMYAFSQDSKVVKEAVTNGDISISTAIQLQKEIPEQEERAQAVKKAVENKVKKVEEITGKDKKEGKAEEIALEIMGAFDLSGVYKNSLINIIKKYL